MKDLELKNTAYYNNSSIELTASVRKSITISINDYPDGALSTIDIDINQAKQLRDFLNDFLKQ